MKRPEVLTRRATGKAEVLCGVGRETKAEAAAGARACIKARQPRTRRTGGVARWPPRAGANAVLAASIAWSRWGGPLGFEARKGAERLWEGSM